MCFCVSGCCHGRVPSRTVDVDFVDYAEDRENINHSTREPATSDLYAKLRAMTPTRTSTPTPTLTDIGSYTADNRGGYDDDDDDTFSVGSYDNLE